jgi:hypothetical protein
VLATLLARLRRLDGRPRKFAALGCVVMAAFAALHHSSPASSRYLEPGRGEVAMSLVLADGGAAHHFLRPGDRVDLLSDTDSLTLSGVVVLDVRTESSPSLMSGSTPANTNGGTSLVVAVHAADVAKATVLRTHLVYATPHDSR